MVDSVDRDTSKYYKNGDFVVYLPRVYENVVSLRLMGGEFPLIADAKTHSYTLGQNIPSSNFGSDPSPSNTYYFLMDLEGLNKTDECAVAGNRSTYPDGYFAKIPATGQVTFIEYNDHSAQENIAKYTPAIGKLDRIHIRTRVHSQQGNQGFMYWPTDFSLSFEIEYLDNVFDDFSQFETRVRERD